MVKDVSKGEELQLSPSKILKILFSRITFSNDT